MTYLPMPKFNQCVKRYKGHYKVRSFRCLDRFFCMAFAQLAFRGTLRDAVVCLRPTKPELYHMGISLNISRSTWSDANEKRDWRIYADFAQVLINVARPLYTDEDIGAELDDTVYALDSSIIDLRLCLFLWAHFQETKGAVKLHTPINLRGNMFEFIHISVGKVRDAEVLNILHVETGAFYIFDQGYVCYARLHKLHQAVAFFITRDKSNFTFRRLYSSPVDKSTSLRYDQTVFLTAYYGNKNFPYKIRCIVFFGPETNKRLAFITSAFVQPALTIALLYKVIWQVELFFKWIKQHLRLKPFYGTSSDTFKTQIWTSISIYVLVAILIKRMGLRRSLCNILQILNIIIVERIPILQSFRQIDYIIEQGAFDNNLI